MGPIGSPSHVFRSCHQWPNPGARARTITTSCLTDLEVRPGRESTRRLVVEAGRRTFPARSFVGERGELGSGRALVRHRQGTPVKSAHHLVLLEAVDQDVEKRGLFL